MELYTIGFAGKSAEQFFTSLVNHGVKKVIDIRLNNVSQLAGFTKKNDLKYFLKVIANIEYEHLPQLAATKELMDGYRQGKNPLGGIRNRLPGPAGGAAGAENPETGEL